MKGYVIPVITPSGLSFDKAPVKIKKKKIVHPDKVKPPQEYQLPSTQNYDMDKGIPNFSHKHLANIYEHYRKNGFHHVQISEESEPRRFGIKQGIKIEARKPNGSRHYVELSVHPKHKDTPYQIAHHGYKMDKGKNINHINQNAPGENHLERTVSEAHNHLKNLISERFR